MNEPFRPKYADLEEARLLIRARYPDLDPDRVLIAACLERRIKVTRCGRPFIPDPKARPQSAWYASPMEEYIAMGNEVQFLRADLDALWPAPKNEIVKAKNQGGRLPKWDWEGALIEVTRVANTPDGLPTGRGAQAEIERIMRDWFIATYDGAPSISDIRERARRIMAAITKDGN
jgi:hypothetical protein